MSTAALNLDSSRASRFLDATIGKKALMAVTGLILFGFVCGHLVGNLQIYAGPDKINRYAKFLQSLGGALWGIRAALLTCVVLHVWASFELWLLQRKARPVAYRKKANLNSTYASRTMLWSGPIIGAFVIYHVLHFTLGTVLPEGLARVPGTDDVDVYKNMVVGFSQPLVSLCYVIAMVLLGLHLNHGLWSMFQSVGFSHPKYTPRLKQLAILISTLIAAGNISIPLAVLAGVVK